MIQLEHVNFGYEKNRPLFCDLNVSMEPGHIYGLLGKNGAGKTTLLKIIEGLRFPQSGSVKVFEENACLRKTETLQNIYFLQEEMYVPHLKLSKYESAYAPFYPYFSHDQFVRYLSDFDIENLNIYIDRLSQGQKKKVLIAFALATNTPILIMDEPTNGLDIPSKSIFRRIMASAIDESRLVIISTHQVRDLHSLIDAVTIIEKGKIVLNASAYEITDKLLFDVNDRMTNQGEVLYSEDTPQGVLQVKSNVEHLDSNLDLEMLFNAVMFNKESIVELFK